MMAPSVKSALVMGALAHVAVGNPVSQLVKAREQTYCTSTTTYTVDPSIYDPPVPTFTVSLYTAGVTAYVAGDCGGCAYLEGEIYGLTKGAIPTPKETTTVRVKGTATFTWNYCSGYLTLPDKRSAVGVLQPQTEPIELSHEASLLPFEGAEEGEQCTATIFSVPSIDLGPTRTVYTTTTTTPRTVHCGNCTNASPVPLPVGVPPVALFTTTVTATEAYTEAELVCSTPLTYSHVTAYATPTAW